MPNYEQKWYEGVRLIQELEPLADFHGMIVVVNSCRAKNGESEFQHVMINNGVTGKRLLNWWPTKGTWWDGKSRGITKNVEELITIAKRHPNYNG